MVQHAARQLRQVERRESSPPYKARHAVPHLSDSELGLTPLAKLEDEAEELVKYRTFFFTVTSIVFVSLFLVLVVLATAKLITGSMNARPFSLSYILRDTERIRAVSAFVENGC